MDEACADAGWTRECAWENYGAGVGARGGLCLVYYLAMKERDEEIKHFHRFHGYDYSRGAAMMLSFHLEPRVPVFGRVNGDRMEYSEIGMIARRVLAKERDRTPDVQLKKSIIMPEHVHLRLYLRPGCPAL